MAEIDDLIRRLVRDEVRAALLQRERPDADDMVPHARWPFPSRREACEAAAAGKIDGARKVGRCWYASKRALAAYLEANAAPAPCASADVVSIVDAAARRRRHG